MNYIQSLTEIMKTINNEDNLESAKNEYSDEGFWDTVKSVGKRAEIRAYDNSLFK